jgi:hypothetical protein
VCTKEIALLQRITDSTFEPEQEPSELAQMFPTMSEDGQRELEDHITKHGLLQAIVVDADGRILDGRHRYQACIKSGVEAFFDRYVGDDPVAFVVGANRWRDQRAARGHAPLGLQFDLGSWRVPRLRPCHPASSPQMLTPITVRSTARPDLCRQSTGSMKHDAA